jgi:hypothetical protein
MVVRPTYHVQSAWPDLSGTVSMASLSVHSEWGTRLSDPGTLIFFKKNMNAAKFG